MSLASLPRHGPPCQSTQGGEGGGVLLLFPLLLYCLPCLLLLLLLPLDTPLRLPPVPTPTFSPWPYSRATGPLLARRCGWVLKDATLDRQGVAGQPNEREPHKNGTAGSRHGWQQIWPASSGSRPPLGTKGRQRRRVTRCREEALRRRRGSTGGQIKGDHTG